MVVQVACEFVNGCFCISIASREANPYPNELFISVITAKSGFSKKVELNVGTQEYSFRVKD